ncbi:MAG: heme-binding protein [Gammaproteobacteria bacterium]|nr:MAG: heme-binding protein [Gammaproteobacteria bacterium]
MNRRLMLGLGFVLSVVGISVAGADDKVFVNTRALSAVMASRVAAATEQACAKRGYQVAVAVTDRYGNLLAFLRNPLAGAHTITIAKYKAYTAATFQLATLGLDQRLGFLKGMPKLSLTGGGVPIRAAGFMYGAVGVSGAPREKQPGDVDDVCAREGIKAIQEDLDFSSQ